MRRLVVTALVMCLPVSTAACGRTADTVEDVQTPPLAETATSAPPSKSVQLAELGATLDIATGSGSASYTVGNWRPVPPEAQVIPAKGVMYSVDVTIEGKAGTTLVNGFYFAVRTADGGSVAPAVGSVRPAITSGELTAGQSVAGHVAFDLAPGTAVTAVILRDPAGRGLAAWSVEG